MRIDCLPEDLFDVFDDGWSFATWVVGAARIREVDGTWPSPGSRIHHSIGMWPLLLNDTTSVVAYDRPHSIELKARAWPAGEATVLLTCTPDGDGTLVEMTEEPAGGPVKLIPSAVLDPPLHARNKESLTRLGFLARRSRSGRGVTG